MRSVVPVSSVSCGVPVTVTASLKLTCTEITEVAAYEPFVVDELTDVTVGAVVSDVMVTVVDCGEPINVVCALPAVSAIEKDPAAVNSETFAPPPDVAVDVALMVQTLADV